MTAAVAARRRPRQGVGWVARVVLALLPPVVLLIGLRSVTASLDTPLSPSARNLALLLAALPLCTTMLLAWRGVVWDPVVAGCVWMLCALSAVTVARVAPVLLTKQLLWMVIGWAAAVTLLLVPNPLEPLRRYKYTWLSAGLLLTAVTLVFGRDLNHGGIRLWLQLGPLTIQPSELLRVLLVVFLAAYLDERRELLTAASSRIAGMRLPSLPYLLPLLAMVSVTLLVLVFQHDLAPALLYFGTFVAMVHVATGRRSYLLLGIALFLTAAVVGYSLSEHVHDRVAIWLDPYHDAGGAGYQSLQELGGLAFGGIGGTGVGYGYPTLIPAAHTDYPIAVVGEEWGLLGTLAVILLYAVLTVRILDLSARLASDRFGQLLGAGIGITLGLQSMIVIGGALRLTPLAGITSPFLSYGGSSMLMLWISLGLLVRTWSKRRAEGRVA